MTLRTIPTPTPTTVHIRAHAKEDRRAPSNTALDMAISRTTTGAAAAPRIALGARAGGHALSAAGHRALAAAGLHPRPWVGRLRRALRRGAFVVHYQPIVAIAGGAVSHHEALVRLADQPDGRLVAPAAFLPTAERHGLVREIDRFVIARVAALLGARSVGVGAGAQELPGGGAGSMPDGTGSMLGGGTQGLPWGSKESLRGGDTESVPAGGVGSLPGYTQGLSGGGTGSLPGGGTYPPPRRAALNLSALSVTDVATLPHIERALERHAVDPAQLVIEITETAAIRDMARAQAFCERVLALGCTVALDDFGVGFGSLAYAKRLPCTYLKIDGDFVRDLTRSREDRVLVRAIVDLARGLGRETIAECVGDDATLALLGELGVDYAQGFHLGRPTAISQPTA